jgi:putative salt-induced outer membrane protein YdiY
MIRNVIKFDTDYADSDFLIEWDNVIGLTSNTLLIIYTTDGERYTGYLKYSENDDRKVSLVGSAEDKELSILEIVEISTLKKDFWSRININIDAGFSFTKANNVTQISTDARINYKADKWKWSANYNTVATNQDNVDATKRNEGGTDFSYDVLGNAFAFAGLEFLQNSEQLLDLRTTSKVGVGYYFVRTNSLFFQGGIGIANANEEYGGDEPSTQNSFEGLGSLEFDAFDIGDFSFRTKITAFPSFSNKGRIRVNGDASLKWDLPLDFYIKMSYTHNFDSEPLVDVPNSDYVFKTSFGWEWD